MQNWNFEVLPEELFYLGIEQLQLTNEAKQCSEKRFNSLEKVKYRLTLDGADSVFLCIVGPVPSLIRYKYSLAQTSVVAMKILGDGLTGKEECLSRINKGNEIWLFKVAEWKPISIWFSLRFYDSQRVLPPIF